ncbi:MAG TPA: TIGR03086 family metal-binding protein, partial [Acidimicrobiales bacterium]|nr:TIGR03086 family metal-binding protein [Acidimicrobiales bacterium]
GTLVRLVHEGLTSQQAEGHGVGWDHYLGRLAAAAAAPAADAGPDEWSASPDPLDRLSAAEATAAVCQRVLRAVPADAASSPTPCAAYDVDALAEHLLGSIRSLGAMAGASTGGADAGSLEERVADATQLALEAWRRRGTDGEVAFGSGSLPAQRAAAILSIEYLVHAWDFATATAQPLEVDASVSAYVLALAHDIVQPAMRDGDRFAEAVEVAADADTLARLVAYTGRTP